VYEVAISCAYAMAMLALAGIWQALHDPARRCWWLAVASLAYGLAVGARPTLLFGGVILLLPVVSGWSAVSKQDERRWSAVACMLAAALVPISFVGFGLMLYNYLRFHNPLEFGQHYQLGGTNESALRHLFSPRYVWFNFQVYFLRPVHWTGFFPFVDGIKAPPSPAGQIGVDGPFGVLINLPFTWTALVVPLAWQKRAPGGLPVLRTFLAALAFFFVISALNACFFAGACMRYQVEFVPGLALLAMGGFFGWDRALAANPKWRNAVRCGWIAALFFSVMISLLLTVQRYVEEQFRDGLGQLHLGRAKEAVPYFTEALRINPNYAMAHYYFALDLVQAGRLPEAINHYEQVLRLDPGYPGAREALSQARQKLKEQPAPPN
jgi:hypothetical protein